MADESSADDGSAPPPLATEQNDSQESDHPVAALPPEFFMPLEAFDSVHHTLANLPEDGLDAGYLAAQTAQTQVVLDAINSQLSARVMRSYGAFVHGMAQVQQLESDLVLTAILCRSARRHLGKVQGGAVVGGLRLLWRLRRRRILEQLTTTLRTLAALSSGIGQLERLLKQPNPLAIASLPEAAGVLKGCEARVTQLDGYKMARAIGPRISKASDRLTAILMKALQAVRCCGCCHAGRTRTHSARCGCCCRARTHAHSARCCCCCCRAHTHAHSARTACCHAGRAHTRTPHGARTPPFSVCALSALSAMPLSDTPLPLLCHCCCVCVRAAGVHAL